MLLGAALGLGLAGAGLAGEIKKLPEDVALPQGSGSPGKVTFSHASHVDAAKPSCVACHPAQFKILAKGSTATGAPIQHAVMEKGGQCGACHGKAAFGFDSCDMCHK
jgi:c(7)-type cytochrome triheme protein